jgi:mannosyltransferase
MFPTLRGWLRTNAWRLSLAVVALDMVLGAIFRFSTTSKLWLDEALTANIASHPFGEIVLLLKHDGAPPLYYFLLHIWMSAFGSSDVALRACSGVISICTLPLVYLILKRVWGQKAGFLGLGFASCFPFAVYYAGEVRMYSLVMFLGALLLLLVFRMVDRPSWGLAIAVAAVSALLLYTHYWSLYLLAILGLVSLVDVLRRRHFTGFAPKILAGLGGGFLLWAPWVPIFNEQRIHTGTPWTDPPGIWQALSWPESFIVNQSTQHVTTSLHMIVELYAFVALIIFGVFADRMSADWSLNLRLRVPQDARLLTALGIGTIVLGITTAHFAKSAFVPRYAAIAALPVLFLAVRGVTILGSPVRILLALILFSGASLWTDHWGVNVNRSQAGVVAQALQSAPKGSVVLVCPDQLGPSLLRYAPADLVYLGYPRLTKPVIINWYDYKTAVGNMTAIQAATDLVSIARHAPAVYVVWSSGYTLHSTCHDTLQAIAVLRASRKITLVTQDLTGFYQSMSLVQLVPRN